MNDSGEVGDLVERLRRGILFTDGKPDGVMTAITLEAAEIIERQQQEIREGLGTVRRLDDERIALYGKIQRQQQEIERLGAKNEELREIIGAYEIMASTPQHP